MKLSHSCSALLFAIIITLTGCTDKPLTDTPENTARSVFKLICTNDAENLKQLLLTPEELEAWFIAQKTPNMEARMIEINGMYDRLPNILKLVRTVGEKEGIDWSATEIDSVVETEGSDQNKTVVLTFSSNEQAHSFTCEMASSENGWRLTGSPMASWIELE